jgi:competence protein ComEA
MWDRFRRGYVLGALALVLYAATAIVASAGNKPKVPPSKPIDVNAASSEELQQLPGIGPVIAQRIVDYRKKSGPFRRVDELVAVRGISEKRLAKIRPYVFVKSAPPAPQKPESHSQ